jgi:hypothetical protein
MRNVLRIRGRKPPYLKQEVLKDLASEFNVDMRIWERILSFKNKEIRLTGKEIDGLFIGFVRELESIVAGVDKT